MKLSKIVAAANSIDGFALKDDMSFQLAYKMTKFMVVTKDDVAFYQTKLNELMQKYSTLSGDSNNNIFESDEFKAEYEELQNTTVADPGIRFSLSELKGLKMSPHQIYPLMDFINENE